MNSLPSFVELMASLGLDNHTRLPESCRDSTRSSPSSSCSSTNSSPQMASRQAYKSQSISSLRDVDSERRSVAYRQKMTRYTPYSSSVTSGRRGSLSSTTSDSEGTVIRSSQPGLSVLPATPSLSATRKRIPARLHNVPTPHDDLPPSILGHEANTPISAYARRKTPQVSPTSPTFPQHNAYQSMTLDVSMLPESILLPTLPSIGAESNTPSALATPQLLSARGYPLRSVNSLSSIVEVEAVRRRPRRHTGVRLSEPHREDIGELQHHHQIPPV